MNKSIQRNSRLLFMQEIVISPAKEAALRERTRLERLRRVWEMRKKDKIHR